MKVIYVLEQITGLVLQAIIGFIMNGLYKIVCRKLILSSIRLSAPGYIGAFAIRSPSTDQ